MERPLWLRIALRISALNDSVGRVVRVFTLIMVIVGAYNALARYVTRASGIALTSNALLELQWYLFSLVFLLAGAYTLRHNAHVRVDVWYSRLSARARAWIDLLGTLVFLLPFSVMMVVVSWPMVWNSWAVWEMSPDPGGLPRFPIKSIIPIAFLLLALQGIAEAARALAFLKGYLSEYPEEIPTEDL